MRVDLWSVDRARELTDFYNDQIRGVPHGYPVQPEHFDSGIHRSWHPERREAQTECFLVAQEADRVVRILRRRCVAVLQG